MMTTDSRTYCERTGAVETRTIISRDEIRYVVLNAGRVVFNRALEGKYSRRRAVQLARMQDEAAERERSSTMRVMQYSTCPRCGHREAYEGMDAEVAKQVAASHVCADGVATPSGPPVEVRVPGPGERTKLPEERSLS